MFREGGGKASPEEHSPPAHVTSTTQGSPAVVVEPVNGSASAFDGQKKVKLESRTDSAPTTNGVDAAHTTSPSSSSGSRVTSSTSRNRASDDHDSNVSDDDEDDEDDEMDGVSDASDDEGVEGIDPSEAAAALAMAVEPSPNHAAVPARN